MHHTPLSWLCPFLIQFPDASYASHATLVIGPIFIQFSDASHASLVIVSLYSVPRFLICISRARVALFSSQMHQMPLRAAVEEWNGWINRQGISQGGNGLDGRTVGVHKKPLIQKAYKTQICINISILLICFHLYKSEKIKMFTKLEQTAGMSEITNRMFLRSIRIA